MYITHTHIYIYIYYIPIHIAFNIAGSYMFHMFDMKVISSVSLSWPFPQVQIHWVHPAKSPLPSAQAPNAQDRVPRAVPGRHVTMLQ